MSKSEKQIPVWIGGTVLHIHLFTLEREMRAKNVTFPIVQYVNSHRARRVANHQGRFAGYLTLSREALGPIGPSVFKGQQLKA
jgi:hypothetical protein